MKGITPVIAVILLLLITIAMVGFAFVWFSRVAATATNATQAQLEQELARQSKRILIENVDKTNSIVSVRNTGSRVIAATELVVYINSTLNPTCSSGGAWSPSSMAPSQVATCDWSTGACSTGTVVRVTAPGNFDEYTC